MRFSCTQENLNQGLSIVSHVTGKNINLPILGNVLIKCEDKSLKFSATNLEIAVNCTVRGKVEEAGEHTVPSKLFGDYVNLLPKDRVDVNLDNQAFVISCGSYQTRINGIAAAEFPLIPSVEKRQSFKVNVGDFRRAVGQVLFAVAPNESRPEISGVLFKFTKLDSQPVLMLAATDSYRLAEKIVSLTDAGNLNEAVSVIVPSRTMAEVIRILGVFKDDVSLNDQLEIALGDNQVVFTYDTVELVSRVIEGRYPDYRQLIPDRFETEVVISREELARAIRATSLFSRTGLNDVHLSFDDGGNVKLTAANSQTGEQAVKLEGAIHGRSNQITVNYKYFLDGINNVDTEQAVVQLVDGVSPCLIRPVGDKDLPGSYLYIVMPIRQ